MPKYLVKGPKVGDVLSVELKNGLLKSIEFNDDLDQPQRIYMLKCFTLRDGAEEGLGYALERIQTKDPGATITQVAEDLSFKAFWEAYAYKVGKKSRAENKWKAMPDEEKAKALAYISKYKFYLAERPHIQCKYPETYLNAQEWNN